MILEENMKEIAVSVIMPVLNGMPYFKDALDSIRNQSMESIEIIVVDAGSIDGTIEYVNQCMKEDCRVRLIQSDKKSMGHQYNLGIENAKGQYVGFCESDDYLDSDAFSVLYKIAKGHHEPEAVKADFYMFFDDSKHHRISMKYGVLPRDKKNEYDRELNLAVEPEIFFRDINMWNGIFLKSFLDEYKIRLNETKGAAFQDAGFVQQVHMLADRQIYTEEAFYHYRRDNKDSSVYKKGKSLYNVWELQFILQFLEKNPRIKSRYLGIALERMFGAFLDTYKMERYWNERLDFEKEVENFRLELREWYEGLSYSFKRLIKNEYFFLIFLESIDEFRKAVDFSYLKRIQADFSLYQYIQDSKKIVIFGAGEQGQAIAAALLINGYEGDIRFADNNKNEWRKVKMGISVLSVDDAVKWNKSSIFLLSECVYKYTMHAQLCELGVEISQIVNVPGLSPHQSMEVRWDKSKECGFDKKIGRLNEGIDNDVFAGKFRRE